SARRAILAPPPPPPPLQQGGGSMRRWPRLACRAVAPLPSTSHTKPDSISVRVPRPDRSQCRDTSRKAGTPSTPSPAQDYPSWLVLSWGVLTFARGGWSGVGGRYVEGVAISGVVV